MSYKPTDSGEIRSPYQPEPEDPTMLGFDDHRRADVSQTRPARGRVAKIASIYDLFGDPCKGCRAVGFHFPWCVAK